MLGIQVLLFSGTMQGLMPHQTEHVCIEIILRKCAFYVTNFLFKESDGMPDLSQV